MNMQLKFCLILFILLTRTACSAEFFTTFKLSIIHLHILVHIKIIFSWECHLYIGRYSSVKAFSFGLVAIETHSTEFDAVDRNV